MQPQRPAGRRPAVEGVQRRRRNGPAAGVGAGARRGRAAEVGHRDARSGRVDRAASVRRPDARGGRGLRVVRPAEVVEDVPGLPGPEALLQLLEPERVGVLRAPALAEDAADERGDVDDVGAGPGLGGLVQRRVLGRAVRPDGAGGAHLLLRGVDAGDVGVDGGQQPGALGAVALRGAGDLRGRLARCVEGGAELLLVHRDVVGVRAEELRGPGGAGVAEHVHQEHPVLRAGVPRAEGGVGPRGALDVGDAEGVAADDDAGLRALHADGGGVAEGQRRVLVERVELPLVEVREVRVVEGVVHLELVGEVRRGVPAVHRPASLRVAGRHAGGVRGRDRAGLPGRQDVAHPRVVRRRGRGRGRRQGTHHHRARDQHRDEPHGVPPGPGVCCRTNDGIPGGLRAGN